MSRKKGEGRGLEAFEVALIKNMRHRRMPRDYIMSFIVRPGRTISPAAVDDVSRGRIGRDIEAASDAETDLFIRKRLSEARPIGERDLGGPTSQIRVDEVLRVATRAQAAFGALEGRFVEFKETLGGARDLKGAVARTMAAYANANGGYIIFGIRDDRTPIGLRDPSAFQAFCDAVLDVVTQCFCPRIIWDKNLVSYRDKVLGVIYVYESGTKPVVAMADFPGAIAKSTIYYRYEGKSQRIEPGDLIHMMNDVRRGAASSPQLEPAEVSLA